MDSEIPESDNENTETETETSSTSYYYWNNQFKWSSLELQKSVQTPAHNKVCLPRHQSYGNLGRNIALKDVWGLLFMD